jgi:hypothetical protein
MFVATAPVSRQYIAIGCHAPEHNVRFATKSEGAAVRRGGVLYDARSNYPMQRSANRSAHMASLRRSRPLIATLDIRVRAPPNMRTPPRLRGPRFIAVSCRAPERCVRLATILEGAQRWRGGVLKGATSNTPMQRSANPSPHFISVPLAPADCRVRQPKV